jgi:hypothetical protein
MALISGELSATAALAAHAKASYDFNYLFSNYSGTVVNQNVGPFYSWSDGIPLFDIGVYNSSFALGGFQSVQGDSFVLSAVPEPETYVLLLAGLGLVGWRARQRFSGSHSGGFRDYRGQA